MRVLRRSIGVACVLALLSAGCAARRSVVTDITRTGSVAALRADLDRAFSAPSFDPAQWGVVVVSLDRPEVLYERNASKLYMPASNQKLLTAAAALLRLGRDYRFETRVMTDGAVEGGVLRGNLVIVGGGDPSAAARFHDGDPFKVFREWAARLRELGVTRIAGDLVADDSAFALPSLGGGWEWDDLPYGYAARVSALEFNDNVAVLDLAPGSARVTPFEEAVSVEARIESGPPGSLARLELERQGDGSGIRIRIRGVVPAGAEPVRQTVAVEDPALYYAQALRRTLAGEGIDVSGSVSRSARASGYDRPAESLAALWTHRSPPLAEIVKPLLKVSQNLYAEMLARVLGQGSFGAGRAAVEEALAGMGVEKGSYQYADGSGLSRQNLLSADLLIRILRFWYRHPDFAAFYDALPVAGVDGTLSSRLKGTPAERNVRAKTGTIRNVRALSGYVRTADGEMIAFSMLANNFLTGSRSAEEVQDAALRLLAAFSRK